MLAVKTSTMYSKVTPGPARNANMVTAVLQIKEVNPDKADQ